jgi:hypothetical protein
VDWLRHDFLTDGLLIDHVTTLTMCHVLNWCTPFLAKHRTKEWREKIWAIDITFKGGT